jgi:hypothetical protein
MVKLVKIWLESLKFLFIVEFIFYILLLIIIHVIGQEISVNEYFFGMRQIVLLLFYTNILTKDKLKRNQIKDNLPKKFSFI